MMKKNFFEKGFIISVDSFLGLTIMAIFVILALLYLSLISVDSWSRVDLRNASYDLASILEKNGVFIRAIVSSSSEELFFSLNSTPQHICFEAIIFSESDEIILHSLKMGCTKKMSDVLSVERSIVVSEGNETNFFVARINGWFN